MMALVSSDELAKDVTGAEALLERHQVRFFCGGIFPFPDPTPDVFYIFFSLKFKTNCIVIFTRSVLYMTNDMWLNVLLCSF